MRSRGCDPAPRHLHVPHIGARARARKRTYALSLLCSSQREHPLQDPLHGRLFGYGGRAARSGAGPASGRASGRCLPVRVGLRPGVVGARAHCGARACPCTGPATGPAGHAPAARFASPTQLQMPRPEDMPGTGPHTRAEPAPRLTRARRDGPCRGSSGRRRAGPRRCRARQRKPGPGGGSWRQARVGA